MKDHVPKKRLLPHHHNLNFAEWRNATSDKEQPKQACPALLGTIAIFLLKAQQLKLKIKMSNKLKKKSKPHIQTMKLFRTTNINQLMSSAATYLQYKLLKKKIPF